MSDQGFDRATTGCFAGIICLVVGFFLMIPLIWISEAMNWGIFSGWAVWHGTFLLAWPPLSLLSYGLLRGIRWFRKSEN